LPNSFVKTFDKPCKRLLPYSALSLPFCSSSTIFYPAQNKPERKFHLSCDQQTSVGLLISIDKKYQPQLIELFKEFEIEESCFNSIGVLTNQSLDKIISIK
jgi:selenophosphate synthase